MRRLVLVAVGIVALAAVSVAAAWVSDGGSTVTAVSGTFSATGVGDSQTRTCTTSDGKTIATTTATYAGTASGAADLTGPITLAARSVVNMTDGVGKVDGNLKIAAHGGNTVAQFSAVYDHGNLAGLATGHAASHGVRLVANLSAAFSASGGFSGGKIGGGTAAGSAVELGSGRCAPNKPVPVEPSRGTKGTVSAVSSTSISVAGLTCMVPANLAAVVATVKVGDHVEIHCALTNGVNTLTKIQKQH